MDDKILKNQTPSANSADGAENVDIKEAFMSIIKAIGFKWGESSQTSTADIERELAEIKSLLKREQRYEKTIEEKDELIRRLHNEVLSLNSSFYESLKKPFLESIIMIYKWLESQDRLLNDNNRSREEIIDLTKFNFKRVKDMLEEEYKVKLFVPHEGEAFSPEEHISVQQDKTDDKDKKSIIKSVVNGGFKDPKTGTIVARAEVITWQYNPNEHSNDNS